MSHPFRFGVTASGITDPARFRELAKKAEGLGYSTLSMADHLDDQLAPLLALGAAASVTNHLKLLPLVLANDFRHPAVLAKEATTLHQLSGGRLELGVGAGWMVADYTQAGIPYATAGQRIERLEECLQILVRAFSGGPVHHRGTHYQIDGLVNAPRPWNDDHIPLLVAGGRRRILQLAARYADIVGLIEVVESFETASD